MSPLASVELVGRLQIYRGFVEQSVCAPAASWGIGVLVIEIDLHDGGNLRRAPRRPLP